MQKDVIYIDTEDDITSIIDKVKRAEHKVVALVPPKRVGSLQSVVNLKLLQKAAGSVDKHAVLITSDPALINLAAGVDMPVAKNLQSKPEVPTLESAADSADDEVIDGNALPVGDHAKTVAKDDAKPAGKPRRAAATTDDLATKPAVAGGKKSKNKIPNFEKFRKKLFLIGGAAVLLIVFLVWALIFAPRANVTIYAKTTGVDVAQNLTLDPNATTDVSRALLKAVVQQTKKTAQTQFAATGKKDVGNKATGTLTLSNASDSDPIKVPAGTTFVASNDTQFTSNQDVTVPGARLSGGQVRPGTASVGITAADIGEQYNTGPGSFTTNAGVGASSSNGTSGGSKQTLQVVQQSDVDAAKEKVATSDTASIKRDLEKQFGKDIVIVSESFTAAAGDPSVSPAVGEQATQATLSVETTYTLLGVTRQDLKAYLDSQLKGVLATKQNQRIYSSGDNDVTFSQFAAVGNAFTVRLNATGQIGPNVDEDRIKEQIKGKRSGEVQQIVKAYEGVEDAKVNLSPFWVTTVPGADKTNVSFEIKNDG